MHWQLGVLTTGPSGKFRIVTFSKLEDKNQERERLRIQEQRERRRGDIVPEHERLSWASKEGRERQRQREVEEAGRTDGETSRGIGFSFSVCRKCHLLQGKKSLAA